MDTIIRTQSKGTKSLDDFCRDFEGGKSGPPTMIPYTFDDVVTALNEVVPYDWREFFRTRLTSLSPHAPLDGIETAGWHLIYTGQPSEFSMALEAKRDWLDMRYSIGALIETSGNIVDVIPGTPADIAGLTPGMILIAINGHRFSTQVLREALRSERSECASLQLSVSDHDDFVTLRVNYHEGERYPHLERDKSRPDMLNSILVPLAPPK